jgi:hypothetical protein
MTRDHTLIDELLAVRALDGLDDDDAALLSREMAAHGDCDECRRLQAEHAEVAGTLALALEPRPVDPQIVDRIVAEPQRPSAGAATMPDDLADRRDARLRRWQTAFGVAAAIALILAFVLVARSGGDQTVPTTLVAFEGGSGEVAMAYTPGESGVFLWGNDLPDPGEGNVFELWLIEDGQPVRADCLAPTDGSIAAFVDADPSSAQVMAVTVESADCPDAPTTEPIFTAELS